MPWLLCRCRCVRSRSWISRGPHSSWCLATACASRRRSLRAELAGGGGLLLRGCWRGMLTQRCAVGLACTHSETHTQTISVTPLRSRSAASLRSLARSFTPLRPLESSAAAPAHPTRTNVSGSSHRMHDAAIVHRRPLPELQARHGCFRRELQTSECGLRVLACALSTARSRSGLLQGVSPFHLLRQIALAGRATFAQQLFRPRQRACG